jgi:hypothetical protein
MFSPALSRLLESLRLQLEDEGTPVRKIDVKDVAKRDPDEREDEPPDENDCKRVGKVLKSVFGRPTCVDAKMTSIAGTPAVLTAKRRGQKLAYASS